MDGFERVQYIMDEEGLNKNSFSSAIGISNNVTITRIINEKRNPSRSTCQKIIDKFPKYSFDWLFTGEGEMFSFKSDTENEKTLIISPSDIKDDIYIGTPVYDIDGTCGLKERDISFTEDCIIGSVNLPEISKSAKIIRANGDSMEPVVRDGSRVVLREIYSWEDIFYGQIYLVLTEQYRMIKYIRRYEKDEDNYIILRSENKEYDDIRLHKSKIIKLFIVENILSVKTQI